VNSIEASEQLEIQVAGIPERELDARAEAVFGSRTIQLRRDIAALGGSLGPPWTTDQKTASLAALLLLESKRGASLPHADSQNRHS
jgi:hypothetical protein